MAMGEQEHDFDFPTGFGQGMARAIASIGRHDFYEAVIGVVAPLIPCDFWIVARYEASARPRIISETGMAPQAKSAYADGLWHLDPLSQEGAATIEGHRAISLTSLRERGELHRAYARYLDVDLGIADELALLLPLHDQSFLALCLDRHRQAFSDREIRLASEVLDILQEMHRQHVIRSLERQVSLAMCAYGERPPEMMILSPGKTRLYQSDGWTDAARQAFDRETLPAHVLNGDCGMVQANGGWSLLRLDCREADAVLDGADVLLLRKEASDLSDRLDRFARQHGLTERQTQIVRLSLEGHHNASIARRLALSVGGVKNHKLRIYDKLDITSERELMAALMLGS